jgi:hypothetical protein
MTRPRVFVVQPIPEVALAILREAAEVTVYPYMDRQISEAELAAAAQRSDWLFVMHETNVTAAVFEANPALKGIGALAKFDPCIDLDAARRHRVPIVVEDPADNAFGGGSIRISGAAIGWAASGRPFPPTGLPLRPCTPEILMLPKKWDGTTVSGDDQMPPTLPARHPLPRRAT